MPAWSGVYRSVICLTSIRSTADFPDSVSPKTMNSGSVSKLTKTGDSSASSTPKATPRSGCSKPFGSEFPSRTAGSIRTCGARGPLQAPSTAVTRPDTPACRSSTEEEPSRRGRPDRKCSRSGVMPRPASDGTLTATRRSTSDSIASPSFSSVRFCSRSFRAGRTSAYRAAVTTRWTP